MGKRLSQAQIAALHGVSQQTVSYVVRRAGHSNAARIAAPEQGVRRAGRPLEATARPPLNPQFVALDTFHACCVAAR